MLLRIFLLVLLFAQLNAQEKIDGSFEFQSDPDKKYSIYVPSTYEANSPSELMLGLHPLNTNRWDGAAWRDTLIVFAESNNLLLVCPDGGVDGKIDDPIDTAFTSLLLDSMELWYNVDVDKVYAMGFSWGGLTTYTYGLNHADRFAGFMPIGAAINGSGVIASVADQAKDKPFYIIHGSADNPNVRFFPLKDGLETIGACVETNLMSGVGHTIDFPNRNQILTTGLDWLRNINCVISSDEDVLKTVSISAYPNPSFGSFEIEVSNHSSIEQMQLFDLTGNLVLNLKPQNRQVISDLETGIYHLVIIEDSKNTTVKRIVIH